MEFETTYSHSFGGPRLQGQEDYKCDSCCNSFSQDDVLKCGTCSKSSSQIEAFDSIMQGIKIVTMPIFSEDIEAVLESKLSNLQTMSQRLKEIDNHEALFLLGHCYGIPKFTYFLKTAPCYANTQSLEKFDFIVKNYLENILNIMLHEKAYNQATLPTLGHGSGFVRLPFKCLCHKSHQKIFTTIIC